MYGIMHRRLPALIHFVSSVAGVGGGLARFFPLFWRSRPALVAENLFLRKQLAFYQEREIAPSRLSDAARLCVVVWSGFFNWREALVIVKPELDRLAPQRASVVLEMEIEGRPTAPAEKHPAGDRRYGN